MALSVSVPLLLLLLPPLSSAVAYVYQPIANVTIDTSYIETRGQTAAASASEMACASQCDLNTFCGGYIYENGQCTTYARDCRGPAAMTQPAPAAYMAKNACSGELMQLAAVESDLQWFSWTFPMTCLLCSRANQPDPKYGYFGMCFASIHVKLHTQS